MEQQLRLHLILPLLLAFGTACSLGSLGSGDDPRPSLGQHDLVVVDPECVTIPVSSDLVIQQRTLTVTAKRASGHGAEAVPVIFTMAPCPSESLPIDADDFDSGSDAPRDEDDGGEPGEPGAPLLLCGGPHDAPSTDPDYLAGFGIVILDTARCKAKSSSLVECVLDRAGSIAVGVQSTRPADTLGVRPPAPLCIAVRDFSSDAHEAGTAIGWRHYQAYVGASNVGAFNTLQAPLDGPLPEPRVAAGACGFDGSCEDRRVVAKHLIGIAGSDVPSTGVISPTQFLQLRASIAVDLEVTSTGQGAAATLSLDDSCPSDASAKLRVPLTAGQRSRTFFVCADHRGGTHTGTATIAGQPNLAGSWLDVIAPAFTKLSVAADGAVAVENCDRQRPLIGNEIERIESTDKEVFFTMNRPIDFDDLTCLPASDTDAGDDGGPIPCGNELTFLLADGHRCLVTRSAP